MMLAHLLSEQMKNDTQVTGDLATFVSASALDARGGTAPAGQRNDAARFLKPQPFTREIDTAGVASEALAQSLAESGVPAPMLVEVGQ
jgi:hypothetical protein